jgi:hypothetical protein
MRYDQRGMTERMTFMVAWVAWLAVVLLMQAIYVLWSGVALPFFFSNTQIPRLTTGYRLASGLPYLGASGVLFAIAVPIMLRRTIGVHAGDLANMALCAAPGVFLLAFPSSFVRLLKRTYPTLPTEGSPVIFVRVVGAFALFFGLLFLAPW